MSRSKQAAEPYVAGIAPEMAQENNRLKAEALRRALSSGLLGLGAGAATAGLFSLPGLLGKRNVPSYPSQVDIDLPYPQVAKKKHDKKSADTGPLSPSAMMGTVVGNPLIGAGLEGVHGAMTSKDPVAGGLHGAVRGSMTGAASVPGALAGAHLGGKLESRVNLSRLGKTKATSDLLRKLIPLAGSALGGTASGMALRPAAEKATEKLVGPRPEKKADFADSIVNSTMASEPGQPVPGIGSTRWLRGDAQTSVGSIPWAVPASVGAGLGGLMAGHGLVRHLVRKYHQNSLQKDLDKAKQEYEEAMLSQYDPSKLRELTGGKEASAPSTALDFCFSVLEKRGFLGLPSFNEAAGTGAGLYLTGAGLLAAGSGAGTYSWLKSRSGEKLMRDALKRRAALRNQANPPEIHVRPVPVEYVDDSGKE